MVQPGDADALDPDPFPARSLVTAVPARRSGTHARFWWGAVLLGALLRVGAALTVPVFPIVANTWDSTYYHETASSLAAGEGYRYEDHPTALFPVGFPACLSLAYRVFGADPRVGQLMNVVASLVLMAGASFLVATVLGAARAREVAALLSLEPSQILMPAFLMSEAVCSASVAVSLSFLVRYLLRGGAGWVAGAALASSLAGMTRGHAFLVLPGVLAGAWFLSGIRRKSILVALSVVLAANLAVLGGWVVRNLEQMGSPVVIATNGALNLLLGNNPNSRGGRAEPTEGFPDSLDEIADQAEARARALAYIRAQPVRFFLMMPIKAARLLLPAPALTYRAELAEKWGRTRALVLLALAQIAHVALGSLFLVGAFQVRRRWRQAGPGKLLFLLAAIAIAVWTLGHLPFLGGARYFFPVQFLLVITAVLALGGLRDDSVLRVTGPTGV